MIFSTPEFNHPIYYINKIEKRSPTLLDNLLEANLRANDC